MSDDPADVDPSNPRRPRFQFAKRRVIVIILLVWTSIAIATWFLRPFDARLGVRLPERVVVPGAIAVAIGAVLVLICGAALSGVGIGTLGGQERFMPKEFVASGLFRFSRNPMSLGGSILIVGIALCHRSTLTLAISAGVIMLFHLLIVRVEEPGLERRFGESYREYKRQVPRWIPRLRRPIRGP